MEIDALIADNQMRKRDERFADQNRHKAQPHPLHDKRPAKPDSKFGPTDFQYDPTANTCICPAGKALYAYGKQCTTNGRVYHKFQGAKRVCGLCALRDKCLRHPDRTPTRQVAFFATHQASPLKHTEQMKQRIDSDQGRALYGGRFATVEPVFGNLRHNVSRKNAPANYCGCVFLLLKRGFSTASTIKLNGARHSRRVRSNAVLCSDFDVLDFAGRRWNEYSVFSHPFDMKFNCFSNLAFNIGNIGASGDASRQVRNVSRVIAFGFLDYDCVTHKGLTFLGQTVSEYCSMSPVQDRRSAFLAL